MKRLFFLAFFLSACASGKLRYTSAGEYQKGERKVSDEVKIDQSDKDSIQSFYAGSEDVETFEDIYDQDKIATEEKTKLSERLLDKLAQEDVETSNKVSSYYERLTKERTISENPTDDKHSNAGNVLLIIALIFAILCILLMIKGNNVTATDNSPEGCGAALAAAFVYVLFGLIFGILALILLIIALIILAANSAERQ